MSLVREALADAVDACDREPIHIPGSIQPHGFLLALDSDGRIAQASTNAAPALGTTQKELLGSDPSRILGKSVALRAAVEAGRLDPGPKYLQAVTAPGGTRYHALAHRQNGVVVLEFEEMSENGDAAPAGMVTVVTDFMSQLAKAASADEMNRVVARELRKLTGFDRVLIYRFDPHWNGTVIAEDRNEELPSYLDLRFPASDIPAQARELYRVNRLRIIPDAEYTPVPVEPAAHPDTGRPLDMTYSVLRSVSPVHVQYMRNMGTAASMSISILRDGELWGLVSCHNKVARKVPFEIRSVCDMIALVLATQLAAADHQTEAQSRIALQSTQTKLLAHMTAESSFADGLARHPEELLGAVQADGAAILFDEQCRMVGRTPSEQEIRDFVSWLAQRPEKNGVFHTESLRDVYPEGERMRDLASGILAASISSLHDSYIVWFRPEVIQTVRWGGDPHKPTEPGAAGRLSPRHSFEVWKEQVLGCSLPWSGSQIGIAGDLREAIVRVVLRKAEELAQLSSELQRSNQELEAFSYSVSHDLRAPFRHILGFGELLREQESAALTDTGRRYVDTIIESAHFAGTLVDNLLSFSRIGRASLNLGNVDTQRLVEEVKSDTMAEEPGRRIEWRVTPLPQVRADLFMLRLVFRNLIANSVKFTRPRETAVIEISSTHEDHETVFTVRDNGVGFEAQYADKLFGIFQRLHRMEDFEGTGIGLANVRRIVSRHGGRTWAEGAVDEGAAFSFTLPDFEEAG
jgi:chemotaxis family two-component system sensor kinase Cph1